MRCPYLESCPKQKWIEDVQLFKNPTRDTVRCRACGFSRGSLKIHKVEGVMQSMTTIPAIPEEIVTERLLLRMPKPGDGAIVNEAIQASINELQPWMQFAQIVPTVEETEINTVEAHLNFLKKTVLRYLIFDKGTGQFIGSTGFHDIEWEVPKLEIGYWVATRVSGRGYVTEAVKRLTQLALDELGCKRIEIRCEAENVASRKVAEKAGFQLEGILQNDELSADGTQITDTCIYAVVPDERY